MSSAAQREKWKTKSRAIYARQRGDEYLARFRDVPPTAERRRELLELQGGLCAICRQPLDAADADLDHDHGCCDLPAKRSCGQCDRGAVHHRCNLVVGLAHDDPAFLQQVIDYLEQAATQPARSWRNPRKERHAANELVRQRAEAARRERAEVRRQQDKAIDLTQIARREQARQLRADGLSWQAVADQVGAGSAGAAYNLVFPPKRAATDPAPPPADLWWTDVRGA